MSDKIKSLPKNIFYSLKSQWVKDVKKTKISNSSLPESDNLEAKNNETIYSFSSYYQPTCEPRGIAFLKNLTSDINSNGESWEHTAHILYMHTQCIRKYQETVKNDPKLITIYENMKQQLKQAVALTNKLCLVLGQIFLNPDDDSEQFKMFNQLLDTVEASLNENDRRLISLGPNQNHAILI